MAYFKTQNFSWMNSKIMNLEIIEIEIGIYKIKKELCMNNLEKECFQLKMYWNKKKFCLRTRNIFIFIILND